MLSGMASPKRLAVVAVGLVVGVGGAVAAVPVVGGWIVRYEAKKAGIDVTYVGDASYGLGSATLKDVRFGLIGAPSIAGGATEIDATLGGDGANANVKGLSVLATGPFGTVAKEVSAWVATGNGKTTGTLRDGTITWVSAPGTAPIVALTSVGADPRAGGFDVHVGDVKALGTDLGGLDLGVDSTADRSAIAVGTRVATTAPLVVTIDHPAGKAASLGLTVKSLALEPKVTLAGTATAPIPEGNAPLVTTFNAVLKGFVPPHPREVDGIVFGAETTVSGVARFVPGQGDVGLETLKVTAGALALTGKGDLKVGGGSATVSAGLDGAVPCAAAVKSVATATLGNLLGGLAGNVAKATTGGDIGVHVQIDADVRDLAAAKVATSAVVRCSVGL